MSAGIGVRIWKTLEDVLRKVVKWAELCGVSESFK